MRRTCLLLVAVGALGCGGPSVPGGDSGGTDGGTRRDSGGPPDGCEVPLMMCGSRCVNTANDARNCGACGTECPAGSFCQDSACDVSCRGGTTACDGSCVDITSDRDHCGGCGTACDPDEVCRGGGCTCGDDFTECAGTCINPDADDDNCGVCGRACEADQMCNRGVCTCATGSRESDCTNGDDDDCDGLIDCEDDDCEGTTRVCSVMCGELESDGIETCDGAGSWGTCEGGTVGAEEICGDGIDQDCDGEDLVMPDRWEPNDTCASCALVSMMEDPMITIMGSFDSAEDSVDCYRFIAVDNFGATREHIDVTLTGVPEGHDYDIYLYRDLDDCIARDALAFSDAVGSADEMIHHLENIVPGVSDSGTYYIRVVAFRGRSCTQQYSLTIDGLNFP